MKNKIFKFLIIISGIILSVIKYIGFSNWELPFNVMVGSSIIFVIIFIISIIFFNETLNERLKILKSNKSNIEKEQIDINKRIIKNNTYSSISELSKKKKYYLIVISSSLIFSTYLGFKFKKFTDEFSLYDAAYMDTKWQRDTYLESITANDSFFTLNNYSFNWEIFIISTLFILAIAFIIRNTIYYEKIKIYIEEIKIIK